MYSLTAKALTYRNLQLLLNVAFFYVGSLTAIILGDLPALAVALIYLPVHIFVLRCTWREWLFIIGVVVFGASVDTLWSYLGLLNFNTGNIVAPLWLVVLWFFFASTLCHSLNWFRLYPLVSAFCAAIAGPFSYFAGAELNDVELGQPLWRTLVVMSAYWAIVFPLFIRASAWVTNESK